MPAKRFRPKNFQFPSGLSTIVVGVAGPTINAATNSTGGTITMDESSGSNAVHTFTSPGNFVSGFNISANLVFTFDNPKLFANAYPVF